MNRRSSLTLSFPVLSKSLQMLWTTKDTWGPFQRSAPSQTLGSLQLWPHLNWDKGIFQSKWGKKYLAHVIKKRNNYAHSRENPMWIVQLFSFNVMKLLLIV